MLFQLRQEWLLAQILFQITGSKGIDDFDKKLEFILKELNTTFKDHIDFWTTFNRPPNSGYLTYDLKSLQDRADEVNGFAKELRRWEESIRDFEPIIRYEKYARQDLNQVVDAIYDEK
ncbi:hypothetical protein HYALB_00001558 [Hymenoscyphus albidus]|uniref:Uncharacterized protein n=1 Tax=Hymenoscyphus albidus TaxID=595503 RepID=A0A9N9Q0Y0_9HELO|nr:hypothetical protein HYALB_00001558 [Hymenoscyphus albidus]